MSHSILHIDDLSIGRQFALFDHINADVQSPGLILLSGPNGIGKSTLLKTITGLVPALAGKVLIQSEQVKTDNRKKLAQLVAYVNTDRARDEFITVMDLVRYGQFPFLNNQNQGLSEHILDEAMDMLNLNLISGKYLNTISDGEWQKANIARALAQNTPVIIMDEPSAFLDYPSKLKLFKDLRNIAEAKSKLVICSTHDIEIANRFAHGYWHLDIHGFSISQTPPEWL